METPKGPGTRYGPINKAEPERYEIALYRNKQRFPGIVMNILGPFLCLSALAWLNPRPLGDVFGHSIRVRLS
jgi:hypothetical protein